MAINVIPARPAYSHWIPVALAPLVAGIYYLSLRSAFSASIQSVLTSANDVDPLSLTAPHWGSHWIYRLFSELVSTAFALFVTAGLARVKAKQAALVGGLTIATGYALRTGVLLWAVFALRSGEYHLKEPWYQSVIDGLMIFAAPAMATAIAVSAQEFTSASDRGFGGINRGHFVWLWLLSYWYGLALISPVMNFYIRQSPENFISNILAIIVYGVPSAALLFPLFYGFAYLSGSSGRAWHSVFRDLAGIGILLGGLIVGVLIQYGWMKLAGAIFGTR